MLALLSLVGQQFTKKICEATGRIHRFLKGRCTYPRLPEILSEAMHGLLLLRLSAKSGNGFPLHKRKQRRLEVFYYGDRYENSYSVVGA